MADQVEAIIADLAEYTRGEIIALGLNVNANLRDSPPIGTPIDTGWASANWVPSIGTPASLPGAVANPREGATPAEVLARAQVAQEGINDILAWRPEDGAIFSTNNVPYIQPLDAGHSPQSPRGFVMAAIERAVRQTYSRARAFKQRQARAATFRANRGRPPRR